MALTEQKFIDLIFGMVIATTNDPVFCKRPRGERMAWVANNLRDMGYDTHPIGMSWGVIVNKEFRETTPVITKDLDNKITEDKNKTMGEYRFSAYAATQIGLMASYRYGQLIIRVPFADIHISFNKYAKGVSIFGKEIF
jgi:hypothetical protein